MGLLSQSFRNLAEAAGRIRELLSSYAGAWTPNDHRPRQVIPPLALPQVPQAAEVLLKAGCTPSDAKRVASIVDDGIAEVRQALEGSHRRTVAQLSALPDEGLAVTNAEYAEAVGAYLTRHFLDTYDGIISKMLAVSIGQSHQRASSIGPQRTRVSRSDFTDAQRDILWQLLDYTDQLAPGQRNFVARNIGLTSQQINRWFCNARARGHRKASYGCGGARERIDNAILREIVAKYEQKEPIWCKEKQRVPVPRQQLQPRQAVAQQPTHFDARCAPQPAAASPPPAPARPVVPLYRIVQHPIEGPLPRKNRRSRSLGRLGSEFWTVDGLPGPYSGVQPDGDEELVRWSRWKFVPRKRNDPPKSVRWADMPDRIDRPWRNPQPIAFEPSSSRRLADSPDETPSSPMSMDEMFAQWAAEDAAAEAARQASGQDSTLDVQSKAARSARESFALESKAKRYRSRDMWMDDDEVKEAEPVKVSPESSQEEEELEPSKIDWANFDYASVSFASMGSAFDSQGMLDDAEEVDEIGTTEDPFDDSEAASMDDPIDDDDAAMMTDENLDGEPLDDEAVEEEVAPPPRRKKVVEFKDALTPFFKKLYRRGAYLRKRPSPPLSPLRQTFFPGEDDGEDDEKEDVDAADGALAVEPNPVTLEEQKVDATLTTKSTAFDVTAVVAMLPAEADLGPPTAASPAAIAV